MKLLVLALSCAFLIVSCTSSVQLTKPYGEQAQIHLRGTQYWEVSEVELLAVSDSLVYFLESSKVSVVPMSEVAFIRVLGYQISEGTRILAALPALALEAVVCAAADQAGNRSWMRVSIAAMVITTIGYLSGDPQTGFRPPLSEQHLAKLRLFCRYPQGLTREQWQMLLSLQHQNEFQTYPHADK